MFAKVDVNGDTAHPLWKFLTVSSPGLLGTEFVKWNFTAFLVDQVNAARETSIPC
jgi:glutathione peroxidase